MSAKPIGDHTDGLLQRLALIRSGVIVVGTRDLVHLLIGMSDGLEQPSGVAWRAGVIGEVADHQGGHGDVVPAGHAITAGFVITPLGQPTAQRAVPGQTDG